MIGMKKLVYILFIASALTACEDSEVGSDWDRVNDLVSTHADFDSAAIPAMLTTGVVESSAYFKLDDKSQISGGANPWPGSGPIQFLFFDDGTCWDFWLDTAHMHDGGWFYRIYNWSYDPQTRKLVTWNDYTEAQAVVRAVDGDTLVLDGDLGIDKGLRMVMRLDPDPNRRTGYMEKCRNIADFESAE